MQASYSLPEGLQQTGGLASLACQTAHRFALASSSLTGKNEVHIVDYADESNKVTVYKTFEVENPVYCLSASPVNESQILAAYKDTVEFYSSLQNPKLEPKATIQVSEVHSLVWEENESSQ